jgi:hypothetical protein
MQHDRRDSAPISTSSYHVERGIKGAEGDADWGGERVRIDSHFAGPREGPIVLEEHDRFSFLSRCPRREVPEGALCIDRSAERACRLFVEALNRIRDRSLERPHRYFHGTRLLGVGSAVDVGGPRKGGSSDPHRNQKKRDRGQREDCASPQGPASYIEATS